MSNRDYTTAPVLANVVSANSSTTLFAAGTLPVNGRKIFNDSTQVLYVAEDGSVASASNYSVAIASQGYYEFPQPVMNNKVTGIWASANGNARTTAW